MARAPDTPKLAITIVVVEPGQSRDTDVMCGEKADDVSHERKPSCVGRWEGSRAALAVGYGKKRPSKTLYLIIVLYYGSTVYLLRCIQRESRSVGGLRGGETTIVNGKTSIIRASGKAHILNVRRHIPVYVYTRACVHRRYAAAGPERTW